MAICAILTFAYEILFTLTLSALKSVQPYRLLLVSILICNFTMNAKRWRARAFIAVLSPRTNFIRETEVQHVLTVALLVE